MFSWVLKDKDQGQLIPRVKCFLDSRNLNVTWPNLKLVPGIEVAFDSRNLLPSTALDPIMNKEDIKDKANPTDWSGICDLKRNYIPNVLCTDINKKRIST